jgi:hypothetical protein
MLVSLSIVVFLKENVHQLNKVVLGCGILGLVVLGWVGLGYLGVGGVWLRSFGLG